MQNYLCNRSQRTKVNRSFSDWTEILAAVGSMFYFGPSVIQHIFKEHFPFLSLTIIYAIMLVATLCTPLIKTYISYNFAEMVFLENHMVLNARKCHNMLVGNQDQANKINFDGTEIRSSSGV